MFRIRGYAIALLLAACASWSAAAPPPPAPEEVDAAVRKGIEFLYSKQNQAGPQWEVSAARDPKGGEADVKGWQWGGMTSLATYALLAAGENQQDKRIIEAVEFLKKADIEGVYAVGMRCQVWYLLTDKNPVIKGCIKRDVDFLMKAGAAIKNRPAGLYRYKVDSQSWDHSASQYGVLGAWACEQAVAENVPAKYWEDVDKIWKAHQLPDGGWGYDANMKTSTPAMTAAGVATVFITQDYLLTGAGDCRGNISNAAIEKGLAWMGQHIKGVDSTYAWYGVERIGVASGYKYFGDADWYAEGASRLVQGQNKQNGSWNTNWGGDVGSTAFAILFLTRGRAPLVVSKLDYSGPPSATTAPAKINWNQRPRDVANLVRYAGRAIEKDLNWQIVNLRVSADDLHDGPILFISGNEAMALSADDEAKLKSFVESGGMLLGNADCGSKEFADSFLKLGNKLFPKYDFRELPKEHPIYTREQYPRILWKAPPAVQALSNGARELMILVPKDDAAKAWQQQAFKTKEEVCQLGADIIQYAVDKKNLRYKGETLIVKPDPKITNKDKIKVARLEYDGNWDPEPGGWRRLAAIFHNTQKFDLQVDSVKLGAGKLDKSYPMAHLTGTGRLTLKDAEKAELKAYVAAGGIVVVDATGGDLDFRTSAETLLGDLWGRDGLDTLPTGHDIYAGPNPITTVDYRKYAKSVNLGESRQPRLKGISVGGRTKIVYSAEDLSVGLVGNPIDGIGGYEPKPATALMTNIVVWASRGGAPATTSAPTRPASAPGH